MSIITIEYHTILYNFEKYYYAFVIYSEKMFIFAAEIDSNVGFWLIPSRITTSKKLSQTTTRAFAQQCGRFFDVVELVVSLGWRGNDPRFLYVSAGYKGDIINFLNCTI